jgi:predicted nucleic acid-binding protein
VARLAGELKRDFSKKGATLSVTDSLIAAVAIDYQLALLTDNTKDFPMKNLKLYPLPEN